MNCQPNYYFAHVYRISVFCLKKLTYEKYIVDILISLGFRIYYQIYHVILLHLI